MATQIQQQQKNNHLWKYELISGLVAGFVSVTCCAPLDITRTRLNVQHGTNSAGKYQGFLNALTTIYKEEGFLGFYKGYKATSITYPIFHSMFFSIYNYVKPKVEKHLNHKTNILQYVVASCSSGFISDVLTNPLWLVRTRMQVQFLHDQNCTKYNSVIQTIRSIYHEEGFQALFKGLGASLLGLTHVAIYFPIYENLKIYVKDQKKGEELNSTDIFNISVFSKICSCVATYPHIVIRTRLFDNRSTYKNQQRTRLRQIVKQIYSEHGLKSFYYGLKVDLIRVLPQNTITFVVYEATKKYLIQNNY